MTIKTPKIGESVQQTVEGLDIRLERIKPRKYDYDYRGRYQPNDPEYGQPMDRVRYKIHINGDHVGHASQPFGFGAQMFNITRVGPNTHTYEHGYGPYALTAYNSPRDEKAFNLEQLIEKIVELRHGKNFHNEKRLLPIPVMEKANKEWKEQRAIDDAKRQEEREERDRQRQKAEDDRQEGIDNMLSALNGILEGSHDLTNFERAGLSDSIAWITKRRHNG